MTQTMSTPAKIANGASLSQAIDLDGQAITGLRIPAAWTAADISFVASTTQNGDYVPFYDVDGTELVITAAADRYIGIPPATLRSAKWVKLRSGVLATPVNQGDERIVDVLVELTAGA